MLAGAGPDLSWRDGTVDERLRHALVEGVGDYVVADTEEARLQAAHPLDIIEGASTGRVLEYDPATQSTRVLAYGLSFANGVALSTDEQSLFVTETGKFRLWKIATNASGLNVAQPSPQATVLLDNLPGYPDNLMRGLDGKIWMGFAKPRNPTADAVG